MDVRKNVDVSSLPPWGSGPVFESTLSRQESRREEGRVDDANDRGGDDGESKVKDIYLDDATSSPATATRPLPSPEGSDRREDT